MSRFKKRFQGLYWRQLFVTAGMVLLTLALLGASFFSLSYNYVRQQRSEELLVRAKTVASLSAHYLQNNRFLNEDEFQKLASFAASVSDVDFLICDTDGNGCLESFCVWDTGEDGSTRFFGAPDAWGSDTPPYGQAKLPNESMDVMAYCYDGRVTLSEIAAILGNGEEKKWRDGAETVRRTLNSYLWREEKGALYDRDCDNNFLDTLIHNNLRVMYHGAYEYDKAIL